MLSTNNQKIAPLALIGPEAYDSVVIARAEDLRAESKRISYLSHDLNNNLNVIGLHLAQLKAGLASEQRFREELELLQLTEDAIARTIRGTNRLLKYDQLRHGGCRPEMRLLNLSWLVRRIARPFIKIAETKGLGLIVDITSDATVHTDPDLLGLIIQNLVENGLKYSTTGFVCISSKYMDDQERNGWVLSVTDQGIGIAPDQLKKIFDAFHRLDCKKYEGVGLGLAIALAATRLLRHELSVVSQPGMGTTFAIDFREPLVDE
jgi:signal transduction histidine kinase